MMRRRGIGRVGRPSLVGTMARTAVVAGTATAVVGGVSRHQQKKQAAGGRRRRRISRSSSRPQMEAAAQQAAAQQAAAAASRRAGPRRRDPIAELQKLADLKAQGVLSDEEFTAAKAKLLGI